MIAVSAPLQLFLDIDFMIGTNIISLSLHLRGTKGVLFRGPYLRILGNSPEPLPASKAPYSFSYKYSLGNSLNGDHC